jgi:plasmid stabilization system protein ParE
MRRIAKGSRSAMTSSLRLDLTPAAREDFRSILRYTRKTWGERQQSVYARRLTAAMDELTRFPHLGQAREDIPAGMRANRSSSM